MPDLSQPECPVCLSNSGDARISPGEPIYDGNHWVVEHAYPTSLLGWCVIVLRRHAESLHDLTRSESAELGTLQWAVSKLLHAETDCLKEYSVFFSEMPRFSHLHFHMIPRSADLDPELRGGRIFAHLKVDEEDAVPGSEIAAFCVRARERLLEMLGPRADSSARLRDEGSAPEAATGWKPRDYNSASPYLIVPRASEVIEFLEAGFGASVLRRFDREDGSTAHAEVRVDDSVVMMGSPPDGSSEPAHVHIYVPDVDAAYAAAVSAGGESVQEPGRRDDPDRRAGVRGPGGTTWWISTRVGDG